MALLVTIVYTPFQWAFYPNSGTDSAAFFVPFEILLLVDFAIALNTAYVDKETQTSVRTRKRMWARYLHGWLLLDLVSSIPFDTIAFLRSGQMHEFEHATTILKGWSRALRFRHVGLSLRFARFAKEWWKWLWFSRYSHLLRILNLLLLVVLVTHYMACFWEVVPANSDEDTTASVGDKYAHNVYVAMQLIQGQGVLTGSTAQEVYSSFAILIGSLLLALVFGNVAMLVSNFNANSTRYQRKLEVVFARMNKLQLPRDLRERIHQYYDHLWHEYESLDGDIGKLSRELSHTLALEVGLYKHMRLVVHMHFWKDCTADFVTQVVLHLVVRVYLHDDYIIRVGQVGDQLFMINRGKCELSQHELPPTADQDDSNVSSKSSKSSVVTPHEPKVHVKVTLHPGEAFGELALIMNYQRSVNVRAVSSVEMCVLPRHDFQTLLTRYREDRRPVLRSVLRNSMRWKQQIPSPLLERVQAIATDVGLTTDQVIGFMHAPDTLEMKDSNPFVQLIERLVDELIDNGIDENIPFGIRPPPSSAKMPTALSALTSLPQAAQSSATTSGQTHPKQPMGAPAAQVCLKCSGISGKMAPPVSETEGAGVTVPALESVQPASPVGHRPPEIAALPPLRSSALVQPGVSFDVSARVHKLERIQAAQETSTATLIEAVSELQRACNEIKMLIEQPPARSPNTPLRTGETDATVQRRRQSSGYVELLRTRRSFWSMVTSNSPSTALEDSGHRPDALVQHAPRRTGIRAQTMRNLHRRTTSSTASTASVSSPGSTPRFSEYIQRAPAEAQSSSTHTPLTNQLYRTSAV
ncbi:TPA: hypothetical protein N0F65_005107 [Lagenidium giganteum]|uniref:Cyclic nucleotide-binding domain-containing protein n=1 Tax=Lagenidium giganteum TaxID=4803 RepID=A0AAV2Z3H5_9STRA|nr:TPA: hypothetical protein N0F65_005107 [Lagenidium giganteum]